MTSNLARITLLSPQTVALVVGRRTRTVEGRRINSFPRWSARSASTQLDNSLPRLLDGALAGLGPVHVPEDQARRHVEAGRFVEVLQDWHHTFEGYHLSRMADILSLYL